MDRRLTIVLIGILLFPTIVFATSPIMEYKNLDKYMTRKELATVGVRIHELENLVEFYEDEDYFKDVKGWAKPYINLAYTFNIMKGTGKRKFEPDENITYVELLTVIMRTLEYEDGIDFKKYPEDYYNKALEIGLANMYIPYNQVITREIAYDTLNKVFDMEYEIGIENIHFNTSIAGIFSGELVGLDDFSGYKVELWTQDGKILKSITLNKEGNFSILGFDTRVDTRLIGYKYRVYDNNGQLVLEGDLK
ncbi:S-layer family protein [Keratinibaculum paraultunense]|uniref:S-layer family protein n=1 Tax=Keratinibaculum paraultunense TaxID=1278232 RepID=A0A4R3L176_9FIRM|nr:S-layer homology domain-containing protein [Keratinibaculum paraultunense]QQY79923.1 S-layer homology domain-containing protein [Keratinibaculum paraultunense]TCS91758.1 S-layer family protein [Keratinibaculum paraultunense]